MQTLKDRACQASPLRLPTVVLGLLALALSACGPSRLDETTARRILEQGRHPYVDSLTTRAHRTQLLELYAERGFTPLWIGDRRPTSAAFELITELRNAQLRGLSAEDYAGDRLLRDAQALSGKRGLKREDASLFDLALSLTAVRFVSDVAIGRIDPRTVGYDLDTGSRSIDATSVVTALATARDTAAVLDRHEPAWRQFKFLKQALLRYHASSRPIDEQVRKIEYALERWRWMPPPTQGPVLLVNVPQFELLAYEVSPAGEREKLRMNVAVGRVFPQSQTPIFADEMRQVVLWPYWNVPDTIAHDELLPKILADPNWIERNGFEIVSGPEDEAEPLAPAMEAIASLKEGKARLRQLPGPDNALGRIKFLLPNRHAVYLHDTPAKYLLTAPNRAFSHGCIRVSDPVALAEYVLRDLPAWDRSRIEAALDTESPEPVSIALKRPIPVLIIYATAFAFEDGQLRFFEDIYGHDTRLGRALAARRLIPQSYQKRTRPVST